MAVAERRSSRSLPLLGDLLPFRRDRLGFLETVAHEQGDVATFRIGPYTIWQLTHPDLVHGVLVTHQRAFRKGPVLQRARAVLGEGLLTSEGETHRRHRRVLQAAFHPGRVAAAAGTVVATADAVTASWEEGRAVDVHAEMVRSTLQVAGAALFGADVRRDVPLIDAALTDLLSAYQALFLPFGWLAQRLPIPAMRRLRRGVRTLDATVARLVAEHRADCADRENVLSRLLAAAADGELSEQEVRDHVVTLLLAGHETTANALTFALHLLAGHPEVEERLHAEVDAVCAQRLPEHGDLERLPVTRAVLAESLRLFPPSWAMGRQATDVVDVGAAHLPVGAVVLLPQWVVQRDARWWPDPLVCDPDRWLDDDRDRPRGAFFPFGAGARQCVGESFAWSEGVLTLAIVASRWRLRPLPGRALRLAPLLTLRPDGPVWMLPERRGAPQTPRAP